MLNPISCIGGIFFLALLFSTECLSAQTTKNTEGYSVFAFTDLKNATLASLAPEVSGRVTSYSVTIACERTDLYDLASTGDTLSSAFHTYLAKTEAKSCLCYFDKIIADGKPLKGFVIEVKK